MPTHNVVQALVVIERKQPDLPRYVIVPSPLIAAWQLTTTTTVDVAIDGETVARRSIRFWDSERWFVSITERDCRSLDIDTGSTIRLSLYLASTELPKELKVLLRDDITARQAWDALTPSQQRMLRENVASARQSAARARRARKVLLGE